MISSGTPLAKTGLLIRTIRAIRALTIKAIRRPLLIAMRTKPTIIAMRIEPLTIAIRAKPPIIAIKAKPPIVAIKAKPPIVAMITAMKTRAPLAAKVSPPMKNAKSARGKSSS
ncbi:hypothetical protein [Dictyobacter formicarum]|uniref:Uncharacterized protein n=1 Tax=Dictyobacter formicarum TaxID=2778368 RepID=A0ABQ3VKE0_9CHLR|nr:hypothetical protein [Dictyobacter formicarum]GHO85576.1 hypothetical protein KSZ_35820 [Dictyobacter formicarum]